jgi:hypothetical protein
MNIRLGLIAAALCLSFGPMCPASASLVGDDVDVVFTMLPNYNYTVDYGTQTINPQANFSGLAQVLVSADSIQFSEPIGATAAFGTGSFEGFVITDLTNAPFTNVSIASSSVQGFDASRISFTSSTISVDFEGLFIDNSCCYANQQVNLTFATAAPEPSTCAMMILGFAGVGFMAYRRKQSGPALRVA